jgi:hypothetical protein
MSYTENMDLISVEASADLSASQYKFVDINADGQIAVVATKGAKCVGVLQDKPSAAGRAGAVAVGNVCKVAAGAAVDAGTEVICDTTGRAIAKDAAGQFVMGTARETATAAGDIIAVMITKYQASA